MPIEMADPDPSTARRLALYDTRSEKLDSDDVGINGFVNLTLKDDVLTLEYLDIQNKSLLTETFKPGANGTLDYSVRDPGILKRPAVTG